MSKMTRQSPVDCGEFLQSQKIVEALGMKRRSVGICSRHGVEFLNCHENILARCWKCYIVIWRAVLSPQVTVSS